MLLLEPLSMLSPPSISQLLYWPRPPLMLYIVFPAMPTVPSSCPVWLTTPGTRVTSCVKLRPLSSSSWTCLPVMVLPISEDCVSTWETFSPETRTSSVTAPTVSMTSRRAFLGDLEDNPFASDSLEAFRGYGDIVGSRRQSGGDVDSVSVGLRGARQVAASVGDYDFRAYDGGAGLVGDRAADETVGLCAGQGGKKQERQKGEPSQ